MPSVAWDQGKFDLLEALESSLKSVQHVPGAYSPWTLPLPEPGVPMSPMACLPPPEWSEPRYVQLGMQEARQAREAREARERAQKAQKPEGLSVRDPKLSGQRLKRVLHVKQAPIYKYSEWCAHWNEHGRRPGDPLTPRSELTKSEFDIQYGAWRKALVEGPPQVRRKGYKTPCEPGRM